MMHLSHRLSFEDGLRAQSKADGLRLRVQDYLRDGESPQLLLEFLDEFRSELQELNRLDDEDAVLEVMDQLVGWCSPYMDLSRPQDETVC